jgi:hypothetical protein
MIFTIKEFDIISIFRFSLRVMINEDFKKNFNKTGFPLEDAVYFKLSQDMRLKTFQDVPYSLDIYDKRGTIDVLTISCVLPETKWNLICPIECKKASESESSWVFKPSQENSFPLIDTFQRLNKGEAYLSRNVPPITDYQCFTNYFQCNSRTAKLSRIQVERAFNAMITPNEMVTSLIMMNMLDKAEYLSKKISWNSNFLVIPIVCTNAQLLTAKYDPKDIDISTGEIDVSKLDLKVVDSLFYTFPMGYGISPLRVEDYPENRLTIIVNSSKLADLIDYLLKSFLDCMPTPKDL